MKITYIISNIDKALAFEWIALHLDQSKCELSFILLTPQKSYLQSFLEDHNISVLHIPYHGKKDLLTSIKKTYSFLKKNKTQVVHTHLFDANIVGLLAAKLAGIKKRIHTRHHGSQNHMYFPKGIKYDKLINRLSTDIISISKNVKNILMEKEGVSSNKIHLVHHGFDFELFTTFKQNQIEEIKTKYNISDEFPVIGVISRYTKGKGLQYILPAFSKLLQTHPNAVIILANATGDYTQQIKEILQKIPTHNYREIAFEPNIHSLYQLFDIFLHTPINKHFEAFGQTYIEALASNVPSIFTLSGVAAEFIEHEKNALVVNFQDHDDIHKKMLQLIENKDLQEKLIKNGQMSIQPFALSLFINKLEKLYLS